MHSKILIEKLNSWLIIGLFFFIPISTAMGSIISLFIFILWILDANFRNQFMQFKSNSVAIASIVFFFVFIVGIFWSDDVDSGLDIIRKNWKFFMLPVFMFYVRNEHISIYINAFVASIFLSEVLSYLVWLDIIDPFLKATKDNPVIFMSHIVYNPLLAVAIYIIAARLLFNKKDSTTKKSFGIFFLLTATINMFITGGRSGQIMFFIAIIIIAYQYFRESLVRFLGASLIVSSTILLIAYSFSPIFSERLDQTVNNIKPFKSNQISRKELNTSVGQRISWAINGLDVFYQNPFFGVGTGDHIHEMEKMRLINFPEVVKTDNPHNNHLYVATQLGLLGIFSFYWLFYSQLKSRNNIKNKELARLGLAIPILFFIVSFGESYLSIHVTSLFFCLISAVIFAENKIKPT